MKKNNTYRIIAGEGENGRVEKVRNYAEGGTETCHPTLLQWGSMGKDRREGRREINFGKRGDMEKVA